MPVTSSSLVAHQVTSIFVDLEAEKITLKLASGFNSSSGFEKLSEKEAVIDQANTYVLFTKPCDSTKTTYENLKIIIYQYLIDSGIITGTIS